MSVNGVLNSAMSGLAASQAAMRSASGNIANVNTPAYARTEVRTAPLILGGQVAGVEVSEVRRIADQFLQRASLRAAADAAGAERAFAMLNQLQTQFGSPGDPGSLFSLIDASVAPFAQLGAAPANSAERNTATLGVQAVLDEIARLSAETTRLRADADSRAGVTIDRINQLLSEIGALNGEVQRGRISGDSTGAENAQSALIDELATLIDVRVSAKNGGGVELRTQGGLLLLGQNAAVLDYARGGGGAPGTPYGQITAQMGQSAPQALDPNVRSGELAALLKLRDVELPAVQAELAELAAGYADALNAAHNDGAAVPAPNALTGRNTGLLAADALGFSGQVSIGVVGSAGALAHRIDIDFTAGALSVDGGPAVAFGATVGGFAGVLNGQMGLLGGAASFTNGALSLTAAGGEGIVIEQAEPSGAMRAGRGFSHFFGLNDLVASARPGFFETGLTGAEADGFGPGQQLSFRVYGGQAGAVDIAVPVGGASLNDVVAQLNNPATGLGRYASFAIDARGALTMTPAAGAENLRVELTGDFTQRGGTGISFSSLFGLGAAARAGRATIFDLRADIAADPTRLSLAAPDIRAAALGDFVLGSGDGRGALTLHSALQSARDFNAAGGVAAGVMSVTDFVARVAGDIGGRAARAERSHYFAQTIMAAASEQRSQVEGVNLDEELANMTQYQQSYNASARLLQAAKEMIDVLLSVV